MSIFEKCDGFTIARQAQALGVYPYFTPLQETTATEARIGGQWKIMVGSNNYLGLTHHPKVLEAAQRAALRYGAGSTGSRFLNGTLDLHYELEARFAKFFKKEAALVFSTGYQASLGALAPLLGRNDHVFLDRLDHASLVDAARLGMDPGQADVLDRYQRWRRFDTMAMGLATNSLNFLFSNESQLLRTVRDIGLGLVDRAPPLKSLFIRQAAGLSGEVPRLLKGEAL